MSPSLHPIARPLRLSTALIALLLAFACGSDTTSMGEIDFDAIPDDSVVGPEMVAAGNDVVWFVVGGDLVPVDAHTRVVGEGFEPPDSIGGLVADGNDVWLALGDETLRRYDYTTRTLGEPYDYIPDDYDYVSLRSLDLEIVGGAVWIELIARLVAVDIETGELRADISYEDLIAIDGGDDQVWVSVAGTLQRIDAATGEVTGEVELGMRSGGVEADGSVVWVITDRGLHRVDAVSLAPIGEPFTYPERGEPGQLTATPYGLWGSIVAANQIVKIAPDTGKIIERYTLKSPYSSQTAEVASLSYGAGAIWVGTSIGNRAGYLLLED